MKVRVVITLEVDTKLWLGTHDVPPQGVRDDVKFEVLEAVRHIQNQYDENPATENIWREVNLGKD